MKFEEAGVEATEVEVVAVVEAADAAVGGKRSEASSFCSSHRDQASFSWRWRPISPLGS